MTQYASLTRAQKAAAILVAMGKPSASKLLKFFKQEELKALIDAARLLRTIPQADLEKIVAEFESEFAEGAGLLDSGDKMDTILNESLSPEEVNAIMGKARPVAPEKAPDIWPEVEKTDPERLGAFLSAEHPQTAALVLTRLAPPASARVLLMLDKPLRAEVVKRMISMAKVPDQAVAVIENQLRTRLLAESAGKDLSAGQSRVASVLNEMDKDQLDEVLSDLEASGAGDLQGVRARLFSFEDIILLSQRSRVALFDGLATDLVTLALRGAPADLTEAILSAIGARARRMIESELASEADGVSAEEVTRARKSIASAALRLAHEGAVELPVMQDAA